jgi:hypothetical protein
LRRPRVIRRDSRPYPARLRAITTSLSPQSSVNSAPMSSLMPPPIFLTAVCARTTPASEHSSVMASAV